MTSDPFQKDPGHHEPGPIPVAGRPGRPSVAGVGALLPEPAAGFKPRLFAGFIDYVLLSVAVRLALGVLPFPTLMQWVGLALFLGNVVVLQGRTGRSVGKRVARIQLYLLVRDDRGHRWFVAPGVLRCAGRQVLHMASLAVVGLFGAVLGSAGLLLGAVVVAAYWLWPAVDGLSRTGGDVVCGTLALEGSWSVRSRLPGEYRVGFREGQDTQAQAPEAQKDE